MVAANQNRFYLGGLGPSKPEVKKTFEETHSWFENNLPNILQATTQLAFMPLDLLLPGAGTAAGAVAGAGANLGTKKLQGRDVSKDEAAMAGVGAGMGAAAGGIQAGMNQMKLAMEAQKAAEAAKKASMGVPNTSFGSDLANRAGITPEFYMRESIPAPGGGVINNPTPSQLGDYADQRMGTLYFQDQIGQGSSLSQQQGMADDLFSGEVPRFGVSPEQQSMLEATYPGLKINPSQRQPAVRLGDEAFKGYDLPPPNSYVPEPPLDPSLDFNQFSDRSAFQKRMQGLRSRPFQYGVNRQRRF